MKEGLLMLEQIYKRRRTGGQNPRRLKRIDNNQVTGKPHSFSKFVSVDFNVVKYNFRETLPGGGCHEAVILHSQVLR